MRMRVGLVALVAAVFGCVCSSALAAVTPGWECVPTTAGQAVVSGGTGASPSCSGGSTAVLAPTYVSSGVGGKPTVEFSTVNVQVVSGSGSTSGTVNGEGNLVVGYAEHPSSHPQTGSNDLVLGSNNGWSSYGQLVGGTGNTASGAYAGVLGQNNTASGTESSVLGGLNGTASATAAAVSGGNANTASGSNGAWVGGGYKNVARGSSTTVIGGAYGQATGANASIGGGEHNIAADQYSFMGGGCDNLAGTGTLPTNTCNTIGVEAVTGGSANHASGVLSAIGGGDQNKADAEYSSVSGGFFNDASGIASWVSGGAGNNAAAQASVSGGFDNVASGLYASVTGGEYNTASGGSGSISGGEYNAATDLSDSVSGGCDNVAGEGAFPLSNPLNSEMDGGCPTNSATDTIDWIGGGVADQTSGIVQSTVGGNSLRLPNGSDEFDALIAPAP